MVLSIFYNPRCGYRSTGSAGIFSVGWVAGVVVAALPFTAAVQAQESLPLDIDVAADPPTELPIIIPVLNFGIDGLNDPIEVPEGQQAQRPAPTGDNPADAENFPANLVGLNIDAVLSPLEERGWVVITETPRLIQLDRGQLGLDITIDASTNIITGAEVVDLT